jgi:glutamate-1-semialdehyde 2,1-aminomutase
MNPLFIKEGKGSKIYDVDGNAYIDYVCSWGPLILGHVHPDVIASVSEVLSHGTSFGAPTELEVKMAEAIVDGVPSIEEVRMVSSGTEAVMSAIRLARGYTRRSKIIKFEGCYHGHSDSLLVKAGSGLATLSLPDSPGVTAGSAGDTINLPYNDLEAVEKVVREEGDSIACLIVEPVAGNMGVVPPKKGFLEGLRYLTQEHGIVLIFDEVITGFRVSYGGAQGLYNVMPDLTCLGKIIGGGFPVGAFGGKREIMELVAPVGPVYQAGTLSGNPVAMAAGLATLKILSRSGFYKDLETKSAKLFEGLKAVAEEAGVDMAFNRVGSMLCGFLTGEDVYDYQTARKADTDVYARYFKSQLEKGIYFPPSQFETIFVSQAHTEDDITKTIQASHWSFELLA